MFRGNTWAEDGFEWYKRFLDCRTLVDSFSRSGGLSLRRVTSPSKDSRSNVLKLIPAGRSRWHLEKKLVSQDWVINEKRIATKFVPRQLSQEHASNSVGFCHGSHSSCKRGWKHLEMTSSLVRRHGLAPRISKQTYMEYMQNIAQIFRKIREVKPSRTVSFYSEHNLHLRSCPRVRNSTKYHFPQMIKNLRKAVTMRSPSVWQRPRACFMIFLKTTELYSFLITSVISSAGSSAPQFSKCFENRPGIWHFLIWQISLEQEHTSVRTCLQECFQAWWKC